MIFSAPLFQAKELKFLIYIQLFCRYKPKQLRRGTQLMASPSSTDPNTLSPLPHLIFEEACAFKPAIV